LTKALRAFLQSILRSVRDLSPIILVILFFQFFVLNISLPDPGGMLVGFALVTFGLTFFVYGLEMGLFPIGESMANAFARKGSVVWLLIFAFALGFSTTIA